jgi:hypothetical protein
MKQLSKIMLAAVASVALAAPAFAWDFGASGSSSATWKQKTVAPAEGDATTTANFSSLGGGITVSSSNTDGANTAAFSYTAGWNDDGGNFDESISLSGSKKVGNWTASSSTSSYMQKDAGATSGPQTAKTTAVITLTDGSITYKLGNAAHLSTAEKAVNGPMGGAQDAEASVDAFDGFSVGLGVGPGTLTVALDMHDNSANGAATVLGETQASAIGSTGCGAQMTGFGFNFAGDVGADLTFTYGSGSSTISAANCTGDNASNAWSYSVMGLGVAIPVGGMSIAFDYGTKTSLHSAATAEGGSATAGYELSLTMPVGDATAGVSLSNTASITTTGGVAGDAAVTGGTELWYTVPIGAVSLSAGYGSAAVVDGSTTSELGATMSMSF